MTGRDGSGIDRRSVLRGLTAGGTGVLAGCSLLGGSGDGNGTTATSTGSTATGGGTTAEPDADVVRSLAERFAPRLYFDANERWFPTDPRPYRSEADGDPVVDGFDALNGYTERFREAGAPPDPTVFYHAVEYPETSLAVVQFWLYSTFDQFTTNFHWHDWEVLHVFVDTDSGAPQLFVASAHSRSIPNNEFLDPDPDTVPVLLSELGSHSSGLSVDDEPTRFRRFPDDGGLADITNRALEGIERLAEFPAAYGLPRDEGGRLPYLMPELDGAPIHDHERLPAVSREDLVPAALTVRAFDALDSPPTDLPARETGLLFDHGARDTPADAGYSLVPAGELEAITAFTGPQLSFEFAVPGFLEDAVADHITTTDPPWTQPRYEDPLADVTDPAHRRALTERYDAPGGDGVLNAIGTAITEAVTSEDAPDGQGLTTQDVVAELVTFLESDPTAVPTSGGVAIARGVPAGEHRFTVNGAGVAPHSERITVAEEGSTPPGVEGELPVVANADAVKLRIDAEGTDATLTDAAVEDDFAGRLYDAPIDGRDALYVHRGGAYTTEVRDADGAIGAFRVNPPTDGADGDPAAPITIERPDTGKASLAEFLTALFGETRKQVEAAGDTRGPANAIDGLLRALEAVEQAADRAARRAAAGDRGKADENLRRVANRLGRIADRLTQAGDALPAPLARAVDRRLDQADRRADQALGAEKL